MWIKADKAATITVHGKTISVSTAWQRVSASFALSSKTEYEMEFTDATYYIYQAQLEQGTFATAWQLAPEDVDKNTEDKISESEKNTDSKIEASESRTNGKIADSETRTKEKIEEKNASYAQDTQPTATKIGDQWIDTAHDNAVYYWTGQVWTIAPFGATAIAAEAIYARHILAGAITTEKLAAECITAGKIGANAIQSRHISADAINADMIQAGAITVDKLFKSKEITADYISADTITANEIAPHTITADEIKSKSITAEELNVTGGLSAITADLGMITSGSINIGSGNFVVDTAGNLTSNGTMSIGNGGITYTHADGLSVIGDIKVKNALKMYFNDTTGAYDGKEHYFDAMKVVINAGAPHLDVMDIFTDSSASFGALTCSYLTVNGTEISSLISNTKVTNATNADYATYATNAGYATSAGSATSATNAEVAKKIVNYNIVQRTAIGTGDTAGSRVARIDTVGTSGAIKVWGEWGTSGAAGAHNITSAGSDIRLKENIKETSVCALYVIDQFRIRQFDWKADHRHQKIGFIADEIDIIDSGLTVGGGYDDEGNPDYKSIDVLYLCGYLTKAMQELHQIAKEQQQMIYNLQFELAKLQV